MTDDGVVAVAAHDERFKTLRHIEAVRNYLNLVVRELLDRAEQHDQSKMQSPEREAFDLKTNELRGLTYGSPEYEESKESIRPAIEHHYAHNRHHPEHFKNGIRDMTLIDIVEMFCDWKASSMRHNDGNILQSIDVNRDRFGISDDLYAILRNTAHHFDTQRVYHHADES